MPRWLIDFSVWIAALIVIFGSGYLVFATPLFQPHAPTIAEMRDEARAQCLSDPGIRQVPSPMQTAYCGCIASRLNLLSGSTRSDVNTCNRRAVEAMASDPGLDADFAAKFPAICQRDESSAMGRRTRPDSPMCACLTELISKDRVRMAHYVYRGGEPDGEAPKHDYDLCAATNAYFGKGWVEVTAGPQPAISMMMPDEYVQAGALKFWCDGSTANFAAFDPAGELLATRISFLDELESYDVHSPASGAAAYNLLERLRFYDRPELTHRGITLGVDHQQLPITLEGFAHATDVILKSCPPPSAASSSTVSALPDEWRQIAGGTTVYNTGASDWMAVLQCDDGEVPYLAISSQDFLVFREQYPDPSGAFDAIGVPVMLNSHRVSPDGGTTCSYGTEGAEETCYAVLTPDLIAQLLREPDLVVDVAGWTRGPVAFGGSATIQAVAGSCLR